MSRTRNLSLVAGIALLFVGLTSASTIRIGPNETGVRTNNLRMWDGQGIVQKDHGPGWHLRLPLLTTWTVFPANVRRIEMTRDVRTRSALGTDALMVQSSDGDRVMLDLHVFFRIREGEAHRILQDSGSGDAHVQVMRSMVQDRLRAVMGQLGAEAFYDPVEREARTEEALIGVNEALAARHIEVLKIAVLDLEFEPKYEQKIKDKKLADQTVELNKAEGRAAVEKAKVATVERQTDREVALIQAQTQAEVARIGAEAEKYAAERRAEGDLYRDQLNAQASLEVAQAEAQVTQAKSSALVGSGGSNLAAMQAVKNLKIDTIAFPTSDGAWFDVREMAGRLGARP